MNFPGHQPKDPDNPEPEKPLRTFRFKTWGGVPRILEAHRIQFSAGHVLFWRDTPEGEPTFLVEAVANADVNHMNEEENLL